MSIGENIKIIRESKNLTVDEISKKINVFNNFYVGIEKGSKPISDKLLDKISKVFQMSIDDIINYNPSKFNESKKNLDIKNLNDLPINKKEYTYDINKSEPTSEITIKDIISKKPILLNKDDIYNFGNNINLVGSKEVLTSEVVKNTNDPFKDLINYSSKIASPKLINYVEPYKYRGLLKTLFYTEINTELKVGDKVFIINGNYDSDIFLREGKYNKYTDGYKVLFIENCKIALDIDYTGELPWVEENIDNLTNVYFIDSDRDFKYVNRQITSSTGSYVDYKFSENNNNIIFTNKDYNIISLDWGYNAGLTGSPGFFIKNGTYSWEKVDITDYDNLKIHNNSFTYSIDNNHIIEFKKDYIYKYGFSHEFDYKSPTYSTFIVDVKKSTSFITKSNFRSGVFNGEWNGGIFGILDKKITWDGSLASWNIGTLLNTKWLSGKLNSLYTLPNNYLTELNNGIPYQKVIEPNNNTYGYNYIIDSEIDEIEVINGNFYNTNFGSSSSSTYSIVEEYILSNELNNKININGGYYYNCNFDSVSISNSDIINSKSNNSFFNNVKSINSFYKNDVFKDSINIGDEKIKIIGYEELNGIFSIGYTQSSHKVYRFYINEDDFYKLENNDIFYIKNIQIKDNTKYPINFFNKKFRLSTWTEYIENFDNEFRKQGIEYGAFLSTKKDNEFLFNSYFDGSEYKTKNVIENNNKNFSVDIFVSIYDIDQNEVLYNIPGELPITGLSINRELSMTDSLPDNIGENVDITNAYIINSDFEGGIFEESDWVKGDHIEYNNDNMIYIVAGLYDSQLVIKTGLNLNYTEFDNTLNVGDVVFLNNLYHLRNNIHTKLPEYYKITINSGGGLIYLKEIDTNVLSSLTFSGSTFYVPGAENRYNYIHKVKFYKSKIKSGIFRRSYINNCIIENENYNETDKTFNDIPLIKSLLISDSIFKDNYNTLSKSTYINSSFVNGTDIFKNGIVYNSIWNGLTFSNGTFKQSNWLDGTFNSGIFYENRSFNTQGTQSYSDNSVNSYYKSGNTPNNRYSWQNGTFSGGEFFKSDWEDGIFNNGKFYYSSFYSGDINGGIIGDINIPSHATYIYNGNINYTTVENAYLYSKYINVNYPTSINWYNGKFNNGLFGCDNETDNISIWHDGEFNNGQFSSFAKWKNGTFNNGKFTSGYGWNYSDDISATAASYSWENGIFNNGIFGVGSLGTNSNWYDGEFNDGTFKGRIWNNGIFVSGIFEGSATYSAIGLSDDSTKAINPDLATVSNASDFFDSFTYSFYGKWRNGVSSMNKELYIKDKKIYTDIKKIGTVELIKTSKFNNMLWESGTFSNQNGEINNSIWLDGIFEKGTFINSSFNPYVKRDGIYSFNFNDTCYWKNGNLNNSDFYISKWDNGIYDKGNSYGMIWKNGISNYMNAFNIYWEDGLWKNGNWYGSYFNYDGIVEDGFVKDIMNRGIEWKIEEEISGTSSFHLWNVFSESEEVGTLIGSQSAGYIK